MSQTVNYSPIAWSSGGAGHVDGRNVSWNTAHDATTGSGVGSNYFVWSGVYEPFGVTNFAVSRTFMPINTAAIPGSASIKSAKLKFRGYPDNFGRGSSGDRYLCLVQTTQPSNTTLANADFNNCGSTNNPTEGANRVAVITSGNYEFDLNATGLSWISKTGYTKLGIRTFLDCDDTQPTDGSNEIFTVLSYVGLEVVFNQTPLAPTSLSPADNNRVDTVTPTLQWIHTDPDVDTQVHYQAIVETSDGLTTMWDTGDVTSANNSATYAGDALSPDTLYRWKVRTKDDYDWGPYSSYQTFRTTGIGGVHWFPKFLRT